MYHVCVQDDQINSGVHKWAYPEDSTEKMNNSLIPKAT